MGVGHEISIAVSQSGMDGMLWNPRASRAHLALDLLGCVREEDGGVGVTGTHLGLSALQGREEGRVQQGRFRMADPGGHIPRHSEVWILGRRLG